MVIQEGLRQFGFDAGLCDGIFGERTQAITEEMALSSTLGLSKRDTGPYHANGTEREMT